MITLFWSEMFQDPDVPPFPKTLETEEEDFQGDTTASASPSRPIFVVRSHHPIEKSLKMTKNPL